MTTTTETIQSRRYGTLVVASAQTPEDHEREGRTNYAAHMRAAGQTRSLSVRRPRGRVVGLVFEWSKNGQVSYSEPVWV